MMNRDNIKSEDRLGTQIRENDDELTNTAHQWRLLQQCSTEIQTQGQRQQMKNRGKAQDCHPDHEIQRQLDIGVVTSRIEEEYGDEVEAKLNKMACILFMNVGGLPFNNAHPKITKV